MLPGSRRLIVIASAWLKGLCHKNHYRNQAGIATRYSSFFDSLSVLQVYRNWTSNLGAALGAPTLNQIDAVGVGWIELQDLASWDAHRTSPSRLKS